MPAASRLISQYLSNGSTTNANGDYSGAGDDEFFYQATEPTSIERMIISLEDTTGMQANEYGDTGSALGEGILVYHKAVEGNVVVDLTGGVPITTNSNWGALCFDVDVKSWGTTPTNELLLVRWTFSRSGVPLILEVGERISVLVRDSLVGLVSHRFLIQGFHRGTMVL